MKVLMISIDKGLLGKGQLGDVVERHRKYGESVERLDIIVFCKKGFKNFQLSENVTAYPTNSSSKLSYAGDAKKIGQKLFKDSKYDLIVTQEPFLTGLVGVSLKKEFGSKLLVHFHGDFGGLLLLFAKLFVLPKADGIRVMSQGQKKKLIEYGVAEQKIKVISTPIDFNIFNRCNGKDFFQEEGEIKMVLHVGRPDPVKDYRMLMKAFKLTKKNFKNVVFIQCGGLDALVELIGANRQRRPGLFNLMPLSHRSPSKGQRLESVLEHYKDINLGIIDKDLKLESYNKVTQDILVEAYNMAHVVVLSSKSESFGKVLVEANACGKPVVSTATTGAKEIIQGGYNGYLVPIGDYQALAEKIIYLLNNPDKAKEMGENGRKLVQQKYSDNTQRIINFWKELVSLKL